MKTSVKVRYVLVILVICITPVMEAQIPPRPRNELRSFETLTLTTKQFLNGDSGAGKQVTIAGQLRVPVNSETAGNNPVKFPAVVLMHGSGGILPAADRWAQEITSLGIATFMIDSFSGRGIVSTAGDQSQLDTPAMMLDAYKALAVLAQDQRIDPARIAIMGFSKSGFAAVYSSSRRFTAAYAPANIRFAAHIGIYSPCYYQIRDEERVTGAPIRLFHGDADDTTPIEPCRSFVSRLRKSGADIEITTYPGAGHGYDNAGPSRVEIPTAQNFGQCALFEDEEGVFRNRQTNQPPVVTDSCVRKGASVGYREDAALATFAAVKRFLAATIAAK